MSAAKELKHAKRDRRHAKQAAALAELKARKNQTRTELDWGEVDETKIGHLVQAISRYGGAVMFGQAQDGGALLVRFFVDGSKDDFWLTNDDDIEQELQDFVIYFNELSE